MCDLCSGKGEINTNPRIIETRIYIQTAVCGRVWATVLFLKVMQMSLFLLCFIRKITCVFSGCTELSLLNQVQELFPLP